MPLVTFCARPLWKSGSASEWNVQCLCWHLHFCLFWLFTCQCVNMGTSLPCNGQAHATFLSFFFQSLKQTSTLLELDLCETYEVTKRDVLSPTKSRSTGHCGGYRDKNTLLCLTEITLGQRLVKARSRVSKYLLLTTHIYNLLHWAIRVSRCPYPACKLVWHPAPTFYTWQLHTSVAETKRERERHVDITRTKKTYCNQIAPAAASRICVESHVTLFDTSFTLMPFWYQASKYSLVYLV